jgi:hypothetical protein
MVRNPDKTIGVVNPPIGDPIHWASWDDLDTGSAEFPRFLDNAEHIDGDSANNWPLKRPFLDRARRSRHSSRFDPASVDFNHREDRQAAMRALLKETAPLVFVIVATATLILVTLAAVIPRHITGGVHVTTADGAAPVLQQVSEPPQRCLEAGCGVLTALVSDTFRKALGGVPPVSGPAVAAAPVETSVPSYTDVPASPAEIAPGDVPGGNTSASATENVESPATFVIGMLPIGTSVPSATQLGPGDWALPAGGANLPYSPFDVHLPSDATASFDTRIDLLQASGASSGALRLRFYSGEAAPLTDRLSSIAAESLLVAARTRADLDQAASGTPRAGRRVLSPAARRARLENRVRAQAAAKIKAAASTQLAGAPQAGGSASQASPASLPATPQMPPANGPLASFFKALTQPAAPAGLGAPPPPPPSQPWAPESITDAVTRPY